MGYGKHRSQRDLLIQPLCKSQDTLAGRRLFYGHPYYAWGAGYPTGEQETKYKKMLESRDPNEVMRLLKENNISYVAYDNGLRKSDIVKNPNEALYRAYFPLVFDDTENKYDGLRLYQITDTLGPPDPSVELLAAGPTPTPGTVMPTAFTGGEGTGAGQFSKPRGIATDSTGNIYVADTGNSRIQKFDPMGKFLTAFGTAGSSEGELREPNGIVVDARGRIYVTDAGNHKLLRYAAEGKFEKEWKGPAPSFSDHAILPLGQTGCFTSLTRAGHALFGSIPGLRILFHGELGGANRASSLNPQALP